MAAVDNLIKEGDNLVIDVNGEKLAFVQKLKAAGTVRFGKFTLPAAPLVGAPYGAVFEVTADGRGLQRVLVPPPDEVTRIAETEKNNSSLFDRNTENQKLTHEEILELKRSGKAGSEIIEALVSNSATFQNKTEFSQDKYRRRKAKKYITMLTVRQPSTRLICEAHYGSQPERVWNLRHDSLAALMSLANVAAGAKVLVVESCLGVLTAGAVERLGGVGTVCAAQLDKPAPLDAVRLLNLDVQQRSVLFTTQLSRLLQDREAPAAAGAGAAGQAPAAAAAAAPVAAAEPAPQGSEAAAPECAAQGNGEPAAAGGVSEGEQPQAAAEGAGAGEAMEVDAGGGQAAEAAEGTGEAAEGGAGGSGGGEGGGAADGPGRHASRGSGYGSFQPGAEVLRAVAQSGFDSCLVANPKAHPTALLAALWPLLAPSATFAVYSPWAQPLAEALTHLQASRNGVMLQVQESWLRPYQVLPSRTHPHMTCSGTGGFILSGIKVSSPDASPLQEQLLLHVGERPVAVLPEAGGTQQGQPWHRQQGGGGGGGRGQRDRGRQREQSAGSEGRGRGDRGGWGNGGRGGRGGRGNNGGRGRGGRGGDGGGNKRKAEGGSSPAAKKQA